MADATTITGSEVIWSYSTDAGLTYKSVVCKQSASFNRSRNITTEESDCGILKAFGPSNDKISFSGLFDTVPDAAEGSYTELQTLYDANTSFMSKFATVGNEPFVTGTGKLAALNLVVDSPSAVVKFNAEFEFTGTLDITP